MFKIEKQESLGQDRYSKNGISKDVYFVAKNIPFNLSVSSSINLGVNPINAKLFYDSSSAKDNKEVETLKCQPMEYVAHVNETGDRATVEVRVSVLSSQHEGAFFRIKLSVFDAKTKETLESFSQAIKVISKRTQAKRMIAKNELAATDPIPGPKRATTDQITEALARLEQQQKEQTQLIRVLMAKEPSTSTIAIKEEPSRKRPLLETTEAALEFDSAFQNFIAAYRRLPNEQRSNKIRKTMNVISNEESEAVNEFINLYVDSVPSSPSDLGLDAGFLADGLSPSSDTYVNGEDDNSAVNVLTSNQNLHLAKYDTIFNTILMDPSSTVSDMENFFGMINNS